MKPDLSAKNRAAQPELKRNPTFRKDTAMTATLFSHAPGRRTALAALALLAGFGMAIGSSALASDLKPPSGKSRLLNDSDITIVIIDDNDRRSSSRSGGSSRSEPAPVRAPSGKVSREEDDVTIRFRRDRSTATGTGSTVTTTGTSTGNPGPKIIIVDRNSNGCDGGGVCVIRP
ncbi:MAG: hypothetical protein HoeaKO_44150 [Hoeflea alexandrii]